MRLSESSFQEIKTLLTEVINEFRRPQEQSVVTDIHIMPVRETGEVTISDDDRETVAELMLFDEDNTLLSQSLMQGLDEELDSFLKDLLAE